MTGTDEEHGKRAQRAQAIRDAALGGLAWIGDPANERTVGEARKALEKDYRRLATAAGRQAAAAVRPMCVGVFGPSQAGKSYLVSILARPGEDPLMARFGHEDVDFIEKINPEGGKESTGLVTRFSIRAQAHPDGFPVSLRLLSESDIIKILANTYFMDGDHALEDSLTAEAIRDGVEAARREAGEPVPGLDIDAVYDIEDYIVEHFKGQERVKALGAFWEDAAHLAPRLGVPARARLFELIWGGHKAFTDLYILLAGALAKLGHAPDAFCPMDALTPRSKSIIDVATLSGLGRGTGEGLQIRSAGGPVQTLPREVVTALTAELRIVLPAPPRPFFEHTDLLDFPGARSRQLLALKRFLESEPDGPKETFLRGKVAYLFDRYVEEQELTSMLLCIGDGNQEVATLPNMINDWITRTHGADPAARTGKRTVLFFVLTKFDTIFGEKSGAGEDETRFSTRLYSSLLGFFGKAHDWPTQWTTGRPFDNCFWLRNPGFKAEAIIDYEKIGEPGRDREKGIRADKVDRIAELKHACLATAEVRAHFAEPERAWDEAMAMNDGGISYLAEKLAPMCHPSIKAEQVEAQLRDLAEKVLQRLRRHYISDDLDERLAERREAATRIANFVYDAAEHGCFGQLLERLQIDSHDLSNALVVAENNPPEEIRIVSAVGAGTSGGPSNGLRRRLPGQAAAAPLAPSHGPRLMTRPQYLAHVTMRHWIDHLHELPTTHARLDRLNVPGDVAGDLAQELIGAARRLKLEPDLAAAIEQLSFLDKTEVAISKPALLATRMINTFVARLGFDRRAEAERPKVERDDGSEQPIFKDRPIAHDVSCLTAQRVAFANDFVTDWVFGFFRLVEENAQTKDGIDYNVEQNNRLGAIIRSVPAAA